MLQRFRNSLVGVLRGWLIRLLRPELQGHQELAGHEATQREPFYRELQTLTEHGRLLAEQNRFILRELERINETMRYQQLGQTALIEFDSQQTRSSFDYQWSDFHTGVAMADDQAFMRNVPAQICQITDLPASWFPGKRVVDIGCGAGRFTYGLLSLGASVTACDQSAAALRRTAKLCQEFSDRLTTETNNLLEWEAIGDYDLAFCFGVVHHTGNTYLAIRNGALKVKPGGRLFMMIYGFPQTLSDFAEINEYEDLRRKLRPVSFKEKKEALIQQFGPYLAHGWFDATAPRINDLLTFPEIAELLRRLGFQNIRRIVENRNHHIVADRIQGAV